MTYKFQRDQHSGTPRIWIEMGNGAGCELLPNASQMLFNHSPDGFEWGYGGSGPAQTALAVMLDYFGAMTHTQREKSFPQQETDPGMLALRFYQSFKFKFIAALSQSKGGEITSAQINEWLTHPLVAPPELSDTSSSASGAENEKGAPVTTGAPAPFSSSESAGDEPCSQPVNVRANPSEPGAGNSETDATERRAAAEPLKEPGTGEETAPAERDTAPSTLSP